VTSGIDNLTPFEPGQSGNPSGRPKGSRNLSTILKEMLDEEIEIIENGEKKKKQFKDIIIRKLLKKANDGDMRAIQEIFDRTEGRAKQEIEQKTEVSGHIGHTIDYSKLSESTLREIANLEIEKSVENEDDGNPQK
jgi:hypothetical protein